MFARGRRQAQTMTLVRLELRNRSATPSRTFLSKISGDLRVTDLAWWDDGAGAYFFLLEACAETGTLLARWKALAEELGLEARAEPLQFPRQGATLAQLFEALP